MVTREKEGEKGRGGGKEKGEVGWRSEEGGGVFLMWIAAFTEHNLVESRDSISGH